jgi:hypothetical protein
VTAADRIRWGRKYINSTYGTAQQERWDYLQPAITTISVTSSLSRAADGTLVTGDCLCPDLLRYENIGAADGLRGRAVRAFFWVMRAWRP